jgi:mono/diheme cytochrome c family protein
VRRARVTLAATMVALALGGCEQDTLSADARRGRQVYMSQCTACHASDPSQPGPIGPDIKGSSRELLEAKVLHGTYPPGYTPKRPTKVMVPIPAVAPEIPALAEYLR